MDRLPPQENQRGDWCGAGRHHTPLRLGPELRRLMFVGGVVDRPLRVVFGDIPLVA